jgi:hypothetical protein
MERPKKGHASLYVLDFLNFNLEVLKGVQSVMELTAKIDQITNGWGGRQIIMFPESKFGALVDFFIEIF